MSTPTPPPDPQQGWQQPGPSQPYGAGGQPQPYGGNPGNAPQAPGGYSNSARPGQVTAAAVIGIVSGALGVIGNLVSLGLAFDFSALLGLLSLVSLVIAIGALVGGIQVLRGGSPQVLLLSA